MNETHDPAEALVRLAHRVQTVFAEVARAYRLTPQQGQLLCVLTTGEYGMTGLGSALHLERSSLTGLIDRAERRELVVRTRDDADRRACTVALTRQGRQLAVDFHTEVTARLNTLLDRLAEPDRARLGPMLGPVLADSASPAPAQSGELSRQNGDTGPTPEPSG